MSHGVRDGVSDGVSHPAGRPLVVVGLMSGTSHDGISAAVVRFHPGERDDRPMPELLAFVQQSYDDAFRARLLAAIAQPTHPGAYTRLDFELGDRLGAAAVSAIAESGLARSDIDAIASHGHTVWHEPPHATWQFGQPAAIAERTGRCEKSGTASPTSSTASETRFENRATVRVTGLMSPSASAPRANTAASSTWAGGSWGGPATGGGAAPTARMDAASIADARTRGFTTRLPNPP